ncbi:hypothetical protein CHARACLAT_001553 [Characodon lateralis]|uniref:Uncharacterized protein n=1 Tax=Characodon lateralis TaxID=208331 RepID=A0ABU7DWT0_9TELE|nr:hypothetical protein [Characodon lateralis]
MNTQTTGFIKKYISVSDLEQIRKRNAAYTTACFSSVSNGIRADKAALFYSWITNNQRGSASDQIEPNITSPMSPNLSSQPSNPQSTTITFSPKMYLSRTLR